MGKAISGNNSRVSECTNLQYEKLENTGAIDSKSASGEMKDRYTSLSMGLFCF